MTHYVLTAAWLIGYWQQRRLDTACQKYLIFSFDYLLGPVREFSLVQVPPGALTYLLVLEATMRHSLRRRTLGARSSATTPAVPPNLAVRSTATSPTAPRIPGARSTATTRTARRTRGGQTSAATTRGARTTRGATASAEKTRDVRTPLLRRPGNPAASPRAAPRPRATRHRRTSTGSRTSRPRRRTRGRREPLRATASSLACHPGGDGLCIWG